ncbi:stalk domain-containing protein [Paenibacillus cisolokensis]|uniref:stalk domain-containing protein n=1 Tax=Paenibacillus cisolokensis TaxID=1658519 RepID=UPI003D2E4D08
MKFCRNAGFLLLITFLVMPFYASAASAESVRVILNDKQISLSKDVIIRNNRTYLPLRSLSENMGFQVKYEAASRTVALTRPETEIILSLNRSDVVINGVRKTNSDIPFVRNGTTYVPLRFIVTATAADIKWDKKSNVITVNDKTFAHYSDARADYWVSFDSGKVYFSQNGKIRELAGANVKPLEQGSIKTHYFEDQSLLLTVDDEHGSHMTIFHNRYQFLVKDGQVIKKSYYTYSGNYAIADFQKVESDQQYLFDGNVLQLIDRQGRLSEEYDLNTITGETGTFIAEYVDPKFALVRPARNLQLVYIDLNDKSSEVLYRKLLTKEEQEYWESINDASDPYFVSTLLKLEKREGNTLHLSYRSPVTEKKVNVQYNIQ